MQAVVGSCDRWRVASRPAGPRIVQIQEALTARRPGAAIAGLALLGSGATLETRIDRADAALHRVTSDRTRRPIGSLRKG